jgi:hypothetical protein
MTQRSPEGLLDSLYIYNCARVNEHNFTAAAHLVLIGHATLQKDPDGFLVYITRAGGAAWQGNFAMPRRDPESLLENTFVHRFKAGMRIILGETRWERLHDLKTRWSRGR